MIIADYTWLQNPEIYRIGVLESHSPIYSSLIDEKQYLQELNGEWKALFLTDKSQFNSALQEENTDNWGRIDVPGNIEIQGFSHPIYVNDRYEFDKNPPFAPWDQESLLYDTTFNIDKDWEGKRIILHVGAVRSAAFFYINGRCIAYSTDSKVEVEIDVTSNIHEGLNNLRIHVFRWSAASYLECQDMWRLSGIERDVFIYALPKDAILDYNLEADFSKEGVGIINLSLQFFSPLSEAAELCFEITSSNSKRTFLSCRKPLQSLQSSIDILLNEKVDKIEPWDTQKPTLYAYRITLNTLNSSHQIDGKIGFRNIAIVNSQLQLNYKPLLLKGINRHEHDPYTAHSITPLSMEKDILLMKNANINAVRNAHYPHGHKWYEFCDKYGLIVVDEANIESHGMGFEEESLAKNKRWAKAHFSRIKSMFLRSRNYTSVCIWSLGNEAGDGINFEEGYEYLKKLDTRPIQYEQAHGGKHTDIFCPMYPSVQTITDYALNSECSKPLIMCEYAHAMGNSLGNFIDYWKVIRQYQILQGGFVWDWKDQGLITEESDKLKFGGNFGPDGIPSDDNFCMNGVLDSLGNPHPSYFEMKKVYSDFSVKLDKDSVSIIIENELLYHPEIIVLELIIHCETEGKLYDEKRNLTIEPGIPYKYTLPNITLPAHSFMNVLISNENHSSADVFSIELIPRSRQVEIPGSNWRIKNDSYVANINDYTFNVNSAGRISSIQFKGLELLNGSMKFNFWRAPVDNDFGYNFYKKYAHWNQIDNSIRLTEISKKDNQLKLYYSCDHPSIYLTIGLTVLQGRLKVKYTFESQEEKDLNPLRVGLILPLIDVLNQFRYFGNGPYENYIDRKEATVKAWYKGTIEQMVENYCTPTEMGNRCETHQIILFGSNIKVHIESHEGIEFSFLPYSSEQLTLRDRASKHMYELENGSINYLSLHGFSMGVGGTDSWLSEPLKKYQFNKKKLEFNFSFNCEG